MIARFLSILGLLVCLFSVVTAQTATIDFDTPSLPYSLVSYRMGATIGCTTPDAEGIVNRCLLATAASGRNHARAGLVIDFPQAVTISRVTIDYALLVATTLPGYRGGAWDVTLFDGARVVFSGTAGQRLPYNGTWQTATVAYDYPAGYKGDSLRIQVRPSTHTHNGATIRIDNIVIDYST